MGGEGVFWMRFEVLGVEFWAREGERWGGREWDASKEKEKERTSSCFVFADWLVGQSHGFDKLRFWLVEEKKTKVQS